MLSTATSSTMAACELDDKCGSHWCHCPAPGGKGGGRESKATASRYKYRCSVQANVFNSMCTFMSIVPPALRTGSNFGCSAFLVGLRHLIMEAKITPQQSHFVRQSGSDNVGWVTHAVHFVLVHFGVFNKSPGCDYRSGTHSRC
mmetsp:Transcript_31566/g.100575  ORF Transcript_31566/g.100575 Transcript_31566/m.100575 type:complete len:144 (-) Transcript_31566:97-528(-)